MINSGYYLILGVCSKCLLDSSTAVCDGHVNFEMPKTDSRFSPKFVPAPSYRISINDSSIIAVAQAKFLGSHLLFLFFSQSAHVICCKILSVLQSEYIKNTENIFIIHPHITIFNATTGLQGLSVSAARVSLTNMIE